MNRFPFALLIAFFSGSAAVGCAAPTSEATSSETTESAVVSSPASPSSPASLTATGEWTVVELAPSERVPAGQGRITIAGSLPTRAELLAWQESRVLGATFGTSPVVVTLSDAPARSAGGGGTRTFTQSARCRAAATVTDSVVRTRCRVIGLDQDDAYWDVSLVLSDDGALEQFDVRGGGTGSDVGDHRYAQLH